MSGRLDGRKVVVLLAEGFEDLEFWVTVMRLREEGAAVTIAGLSTDPVRGKNGLEAKADVLVADVASAGLDAVVVPGGWAPDKLRRYEAVTGLVRSAHDDGAIVGLICHAGLVGISAGIVKGSRATGSLGIKDDLVNAGRDLGGRARAPRRARSSGAASWRTSPTSAASSWRPSKQRALTIPAP